MDNRLLKVAENLLPDSMQANQLAEAGYCIFPFLDSVAIEKLSAYYSDFQKEQPGHFYSSTHSPDYNFRKQSSNFIAEVISPHLPKHLSNYRLLGGAFVVKPANGKGLLPPHQDWNIVNESQSASFNVWIPLTDVNVENGAVFVLPGSHVTVKLFRGPGIASPFKNCEAEVWKNLTALPMKAGEALLYNHALLHASPVNGTNKPRLGIVCGLIPANTGMEICYKDETEISIYKTNEKFFLEKDPNKGPEGLELIRKEKQEYSEFSAEEFNRVFLKKAQIKPKTWFQKLLGQNRLYKKY